MAGPPRTAIRRFEERFAKTFGTAVPLRRDNAGSNYDVISTGSLLLDQAMGVGGFVQGRLVEIWGPESVGKSTFSLIGIAEAQKADPDRMQGWIDMEQTYDPEWARTLGVDTNRLFLAQPDNAEDVADITKVMMDDPLLNRVVVDSIGGMVTKGEQEKDSDEAVVAGAAKIVTRMVKIGAVKGRQNGASLIIINQTRAKIGAMARMATTTRGGGFALSHATTHRLKVRRTGDAPLVIGKEDDGSLAQVGIQVAFQVEKNKVATPGRTARVTLITHPTTKYGPVGINRAAEAYQLGIQNDLFDRSGNWITFSDGTKVNGKEATVEHLQQHPEIVSRLKALALNRIAHEVAQSEGEEG